MAKGRKTLPREVKILKGTLEKSRDNPDAPSFPKVDEIVAPENLTENQKEIFVSISKDLQMAGILQSPDFLTVARLSKYLDWWQRMAQDIDDNGIIELNDKGNPVRRQHYIAVMEMERQINSLFGELGITPAARSRLKIIPQKEEAPKDAAAQMLI